MRALPNGVRNAVIPTAGRAQLDWAAYGWTPLPLCEVVGMLVQLSSPLDAVARVAVVVDVVIPAVAAVLRGESLLDEGASRP